MGARLIDVEKKNRILISKEAIIQKLAKFFETWQRLEQDSRTPTRKFTLNFDERCNNFKNSLIFPWDISRPNTKNRMKAAGVKDWEEDFRFLQQQLTLNQPWRHWWAGHEAAQERHKKGGGGSETAAPTRKVSGL